MAEQILLQKPSGKKRKSELKGFSSQSKKSHQQTLPQNFHETTDGHKVMMLQPSSNIAVTSSERSKTDLNSEILISEFKRIYHLGGKKYAIFYGPQGIIQDIYIKDWDGAVVKTSMKLNISKFIMLLHNTDSISQNLFKISQGEGHIESKIHIGEMYYLTCNSPYKVVQIRKWKKNKDDALYPTTEGISLKPKEWQHLVKFCNEIYSERLELYEFIPCLLDPNKTNHDSMLCSECSVFSDDSKGVVNVNIPI